jgi:hypothetical protein
MNTEVIIIAAIVGVAVGWLVRLTISSVRRRKAGGCGGGCGCAAKIKPKK